MTEVLALSLQSDYQFALGFAAGTTRLSLAVQKTLPLYNTINTCDH